MKWWGNIGEEIIVEKSQRGKTHRVRYLAGKRPAVKKTQRGKILGVKLAGEKTGGENTKCSLFNAC